jgi:hypothetical protein
MYGLAATSFWWRQGGGGAVNVVAATGEADWGPTGNATWRDRGWGASGMAVVAR